jgi:ABC-type Na+ efflux pump permease subunit
MNRIKNILIAAFLIALIPFVIASGQEKKSEQKIKIVIADDGGSKVILDTLITGDPLSDSIVLKNGSTIYLAHDDSEESDNKDSERTKYVINRDGVKITVEGSDYAKVKELTKEIEKTLDTKSEVK